MNTQALRKHKLAYAITCAVFALWGVARCLYDTMSAQFGAAFALNGNELLLIQCVYSLLYFVFAVPAVIYARALGSKAALVLGLGSWCVGAFLFYPAAQQHVFVVFVIAAFVMSSGYCFVEISITPIIAGMGPPERTPFRLNFAHALFPLGILATFYMLQWLNLSGLTLPSEHLSNALLQPYMVVGAVVLLFAFVVDFARFPSFATERGEIKGVMLEFRALLSRPLFRAAIGAQFCCGAIIAGTWTLLFWYVVAAMPGVAIPVATGFLTISIIAFAVGRVVGTALMLHFSAESLLALFSLSGVLFAIIAAFAGGQAGVYAMIACSFSTSIIFPTILGIAIRDLGPLTKTGTALIYIGASGSAIGIGAMLLVWHFSTVYLAMLFPALCFAGVLAFALHERMAATAPRTVPQAAE